MAFEKGVGVFEDQDLGSWPHSLVGKSRSEVGKLVSIVLHCPYSDGRDGPKRHCAVNAGRYRLWSCLPKCEATEMDRSPASCACMSTVAYASAAALSSNPCRTM